MNKSPNNGHMTIYIYTRNLGRYAPKFLAPAEGWWPSATDWQGLFFLGKKKPCQSVAEGHQPSAGARNLGA